MTDDEGMRTWSHGITLGIGLGLALAGACKDDGTGPVDESDAPGEVAARYCAAYYGCDCDGFTMRFDSMADCETEIAESVQDDIDDGNAAGLTYQAACPGIWIDAVNTLECQTLLEILNDPDSVAAGQAFAECKLFYGTGAAGEPCEDDPEVPGDDCEIDLVCESGTCAVRARPLDVGDACMPSTDTCESNAFCLDIDADGDSVCEALPQLGETCLGMLDFCDIEFYCDQADKTCIALPGVGEACAPLGTGRCTEGAVCGAGDMCEAAPGAGEACTDICDVGLMCENNVCAVAAPLVCGGFAGGD
jgi:hypothetical protein